METRTKPQYAKPQHEQGLLGPSNVTYGLVMRMPLGSLPALESDLKDCFEKHEVRVVYQRMSVGYLKIVEEPYPSKEALKEERS